MGTVLPRCSAENRDGKRVAHCVLVLFLFLRKKEKMTIFDLRHGLIEDDSELGLRVAVALFVENVTEPDNFVRILKTKHRMGRHG